MLVGFPLVKDLVTLCGAADGVQHIAVTLAVDTFLECLDVEAQIHLVGCDVFAEVRQVRRLDGVQKHQKTEYFIVGRALGRVQARVILHVLRQADLLRDPEIVHGLTVPAAHPRIPHVVKIVQIGRIAANHPPQPDVGVSVRVEQRFFCQHLHRSFSSSRPGTGPLFFLSVPPAEGCFRRSSSRIPPPPAIWSAHSIRS